MKLSKLPAWDTYKGKQCSVVFQNQLMPKWAHSRSKEEAFQFAITRITSS